MSGEGVAAEDLDRGALWLHLATEDSVRAANAGDPAAARRRLEMARRVAAAFSLTGVLSQAQADAWSDDAELALAARGVLPLSVRPWWSAASSDAPGAAARPAPDAEQRRAAVYGYVGWLASAVLAGWPRPQPDGPAIVREAVDAFRYAGVLDRRLDAELTAAVDAVGSNRFPPGWPAPPRSIGTRSGRIEIEGTSLETPTGHHHVVALEGGDSGWAVELRREEGFVPVGQPVWAVDDHQGLYFGSVEGHTAAEPRVRFQPALQAAAGVVVMNVGLVPAPATATLEVGGLRASL